MTEIKFTVLTDEQFRGLLEKIATLEQTVQEVARPAPREEYLTTDEVAGLLKVSKVTLWHWRKKGVIKPRHVGNIKRYLKSEVEKLLENDH